MKKVLTLALVLCVAGLANASLSYADGKVSYASEVELIGGINVYVGSVQLGMSELPGFVGRPGTAPAAPDTPPMFTAYTGQDAIDNGLPWVLGFVQVSWGDPVTTPNPAGFWFSFDLPGYFVATADKFDVQVDVMDGTSGATDSLFLAVPEPMTMILLGLGGLFIRRK